jgi:hypothetical protein
MVDVPALAQAIRGTTTNGVPFVALPPEGGHEADGLIMLWHGAEPPRTEEALAGALPLHDVAAWRVYLGLPFCGQRLPEGGPAELRMQSPYSFTRSSRARLTSYPVPSTT